MQNSGGALPVRHILGNYELFEEIGRGGMGIVYRALDLSLDRIVAVKILRDDLRAHQSIVTRFSREAQAAARLDHPNIVRLYRYGEAAGLLYMAMQYMEGAVVDFVDDSLGGGFKIENPNAVSSCGCGSSWGSWPRPGRTWCPRPRSGGSSAP